MEQDQPQGERQPAGPEDEEVVEGEQPTQAADASTAPTHPVPAPGEPAGQGLPGVQAVQGEADEEGLAEVDAISLAPPGKPDGEVDTRP